MISHRLLTGATLPVPAVESTRYTMGLLETRAQRARCLAGLYLTLSEAEYRALQLPPALFFAYYPFRPARLVWKHTIGGVGRLLRSGRKPPQKELRFPAADVHAVPEETTAAER
jgi:hypothetical protein